MPATLPQPETYPASTEWRITGLGIRADDRTVTILIAFGYLKDGRFVKAREQRLDFSADTTPSFTDLVNDVTEFRGLRRGIEQFLVSRGILEGAVT